MESEIFEPDIKSNCKDLQTKNAFTPFPDGRDDWRLGESSSATYWCLKTMETVGPDDDYVAPEVCEACRSCYEDKDASLT